MKTPRCGEISGGFRSGNLPRCICIHGKISGGAMVSLLSMNPRDREIFSSANNVACEIKCLHNTKLNAIKRSMCFVFKFDFCAVGTRCVK